MDMNHATGERVLQILSAFRLLRFPLIKLEHLQAVRGIDPTACFCCSANGFGNNLSWVFTFICCMIDADDPCIVLVVGYSSGLDLLRKQSIYPYLYSEIEKKLCPSLVYPEPLHGDAGGSGYARLAMPCCSFITCLLLHLDLVLGSQCEEGFMVRARSLGE